MTDLSKTIAPKSDQLNADDLIGGPITVTVRDVQGKEDPQQPISIFYEGDNGKPYKPCKSMRRILVKVWGKDGKAYAGRAMTLWCDPDVTFGGMKVGGIRISHVSHIDQDTTVALTASKSVRKPFTVKRLQVQQQQQGPTPDEIEAQIKAVTRAEEVTLQGTAKFRDWLESDEGKNLRGHFTRDAAQMDKLRKLCAEADTTLTAGAADEIFGNGDDQPPADDNPEGDTKDRDL